MEIKIIIGREENKHRLMFYVDNESLAINTIVPNSVSRRHCQLTLLDDGNIIIQNLSPSNVTWVNEAAIEKCTITSHDQILLGYEKFLLDWEWVDAIVNKVRSKNPKEVDIKHLERVYNKYKKELDAIQKSQSRLSQIRGITPVITFTAVILSMVMGHEWAEKYGKNVMLMAYGSAIFLTVVVFIKSWIDLNKIPQKKDALNQHFISKFRCPSCGYFFGYQSFTVIRNNLDRCPKCGSIFKK